MIYAKTKIDDDGVSETVESEIPDDWDSELKEAQQQVLVDAGFKPVTESEKPEKSIFGLYSSELIERENDFLRQWRYYPYSIPLNKERILGILKTMDLFNRFRLFFQTDAKARDWWLTNCTYVDRSPMAQYICANLSISEDDLRNLIEESMKTPKPRREDPEEEAEEESI